MMPLSSPELEHLASEVAKKAIRELFLTVGADVSNPREIKELQRDFAHIRESRLAIAAVKTKAMLVAVGVVTTGLIALIWMAITGNK